MLRCLLIPFIFLFIYSNAAAQCSTLGQNPSTAFPVCGSTAFSQTSVPTCSTHPLSVPGCSNGTAYTDKNPFWYKFTCFEGGTLGFLITPNTLADDYDWQLYDITGRNPDDVFTDRSLIVTGNWSGSSGTTGTSASGVNFIQCSSVPSANAPRFAKMPVLINGHQYLLLISHYSDSQSGYSLAFGGGTASITDPKLPKLGTANAPCDGSVIVIDLNKKMKCSSISAGEFSIEPPLATVTGITGNGCSRSFDLDQVTLTLSTALPPGTYKIKIKNGSDGNSLLDNCDRGIPEGDSVELIIAPIQPTPMDSLVKPGCAPQTLELVFSKRIRCSSIKPDGSDFFVTGSYPVTVTGASGTCVDGLSGSIFVQLSAPLQTAGNFIIGLRSGTDGNTIIDECGLETPPGPPLPFQVKDTVNADFNTDIRLGCTADTVTYLHNAANEVNSWQWNFEGLFSSTEQNPQVVYNTFGTHQTTLVVSNSVCSDTISKSIFLRNTLKAKFDATLLVCPNDPATFKDQSTEASPGNEIVNWAWNFANGSLSNLQNPPQQFYNFSSVDYYVPVRLIVTDFIGCRDTAVLNLNILANCYIAVPSAFTPNADGLNDYLYPLNAYKATNLHFTIYNRLGQKVFYTTDWTKRWDGQFGGQGADPGTYVWVLDYFNLQTNKHVFQKGYSVLIR